MTKARSAARRRPWLWALTATSLAFLLAACGTTPQPTTVQQPSITLFEADPAAITLGASSTLRWQAARATSVVITADGESVHSASGPSGEHVVTPAATTTYTLTASNAGGSVSDTVTVTVSPVAAPTIEAFTADPDTVTEGETTTLAWEVSGDLDEITISVSDDVLTTSTDAVGSFETAPLTQTTTFTLTASNADVTASETVVVTVVVPDAPTIDTFTATPDPVASGGTTTLAWSVSGELDGLSITISVGDVVVHTSEDASGDVTTDPLTDTTTFTLAATNDSGKTSSQPVTVVVVNAPVVTTFEAEPATVGLGDSATLSWSVANAPDSVELSANDDVLSTDLDASGSLTVEPEVTTTYTLTASNIAGEVTDEVTIVVVVPPPSIVAFTATPSVVASGDPVTLAWDVTGIVDGIAITSGGDLVHETTEASGTFPIDSVDVTTIYQLEATNITETVTAQVTVTVVSITAASIVRGSQFQLEWSADGADGFDVFSVDNDDPSDETLIDSFPGSATSFTAPIPVSSRQVIRVCATFGPEEACDDVVLQNVVTDPGDYDPYDLLGITPELELPGTLRSVLLNAAGGSVIGFAADIDEIDVYGVDTDEWLGLPGLQDAHLILRDDVTISGPAGGPVTVRARSGWEPGDPGEAITYRSRVLAVPPGVNALLENLVLTGGDFIFFGGAIRNNGTLELENVTITENRSWLKGGGIWNDTGGDLTITDSVIIANRSVIEDAERGDFYLIRGDPDARIPGPDAVFGDGGFGGGIFNEAGATLTIVDSDVQGNESMISGGGIYNEGTLTMNGSDVVQNTGSYAAYTPSGVPFALGGGIYTNGPFEFSNGVIDTNLVEDIGGGLYVDEDSVTTLVNAAVTNNQASFGGGIHHRFLTGDEGNLTLTNTIVTGNTPEDQTFQPLAPVVTQLLRAGRYVQPAGFDPALLNR